MSHELRTPMNSILGFTQLMDMGELTPAHKKGVDHIMKSGKHLLNLINEVLDLSRIEAGKLSLSLEPVQICDTISEAIDIVSPLAEIRNIKLQLINSKESKLFVKADSQKLKQVLLNLINNAVKYNRENGSITIECRKQKAEVSEQSAQNRKLTPDDWKVIISIRDTGIGIPQEELHKLFNPFQRIGADISEVEGTGLGLAVAKKLVEAMHGTIGVESKVGGGSTFWIELPQCEGQIYSHESSSDLAKPENEKSVISGTLLYIEDNTSNIQLVEQTIDRHRPSIHLITEMYGKNTVKLAKDYKPSLILLDLDLPDIHGSEVLKLLQADKKTKSIPVVILSADVMNSQIEKLLKAGAKNYLTKPLDVVEFLKVLDDMMKIKK
jgi:CheY-like chemotaxis protein/two-component sensor histidine kinase